MWDVSESIMKKKKLIFCSSSLWFGRRPPQRFAFTVILLLLLLFQCICRTNASSDLPEPVSTVPINSKDTTFNVETVETAETEDGSEGTIELRKSESKDREAFIDANEIEIKNRATSIETSEIKKDVVEIEVPVSVLSSESGSEAATAAAEDTMSSNSSSPLPSFSSSSDQSHLDDSGFVSVEVAPTVEEEPKQLQRNESSSSSEEFVPVNGDVELSNTTTRSYDDDVVLSDLGSEPILEIFSGSFNTVVVETERGMNGSIADSTIVSQHVDPTHSILEGGAPTATEDMPSFNEWAKKRLEEQGQQRPPVSTSHFSKPPVASKKRHKNYASVDCGAKVLAANSEAQSSSAVLSHYQDDYMLNPCTAKIWLVIELCEAIQVDRLELANYELFSSSPKEFSVFSSDRYPSRDWNFLGTFEAQDEKSVQSFMLHQTSFSKYVKIEMVSHHGTEHFCPLSLVRVFGTSEYEALETEEQVSEDAAVHSGNPEDEELEVDLVQGSTNLFGSAKDAVMTIVKKAAEVLRPGDKSATVAGSEKLVDGTDSFSEKSCVCLQRLPNVDCQGLEHTALSEHNSSLLEQSVSFLSCNYDDLSTRVCGFRIENEVGGFVEACSDLCSVYLGDEAVRNNCKQQSKKCAFYRAVLGDTRFGAFCLLDKLLLDYQKGIPIEQKFCPFSSPPFSSVCATFVSTDTSEMSMSISSQQLTASLDSENQLLSHPLTSLVITEASKTRSSVTSEEIIVSETSIKSGVFVAEIDPTRTLATDSGCGEEPQKVTTDIRKNGDTIVSNVDSCSSNSLSADLAGQPNAAITTASFNLSRDKLSSVDEAVSEVDVGSSSSGMTIVSASVSVSETLNDVDYEASNHRDETSSVVSDVGQDSLFLVDVEQDGVSLSSSHLEMTTSSNTTGKPGVLPGGIVGGPMAPGQKESVFVRLSNRIKALELNMSLSSQYLEELSRRYRKQMEEMQKAFNKTIGALNETARKAHERDLRQQEMIGLLQLQLDSLSKVVTQMAEQQENLHAQVISRHLVLMTIEVLVMMVVFLVCILPGQATRTRQIRSPAVGRVSPERVTDRSGTTTATTPIRAIAGRPPRRRNSDPTLVESSPSALLSERRRPSTEALNVSGTYSDLLIVEPTIPIWVDRCSPYKDTDQSRRTRRKKRSKGQENANMGLYRSLSNNSLSTKQSAPPQFRKGSCGNEVNSAGLLFAPSFIDHNRTENKRRTEKERGRDGKPPLPRPIANDCNRRRPSSTSDRSSPLCSLPSLPLSCNQPFSLKGASLASSLMYCGGYDRSAMAGVGVEGQSQPREEYVYDNVGQNVYG